MVEHQPNEEAQEPNEPQASACADSRTQYGATVHEDSGSETNAPDIERFFCIYCGYDLTGHSGDTRRCSECGNTTWIEELKIALAIQEKGIGAGESPVLPSLLFLPTAFFGWPCVMIIVQNRFDWVAAMFGLLFAVSAVAWGLALRTYFRRYCNHYDWLVFLGESHLVAVQISFGSVVLCVTALALIPTGFNTLVLIAAVASAVFVASSYWLYRDMKRRLPAYKLPKPPETNADE